MSSSVAAVRRFGVPMVVVLTVASTAVFTMLAPTAEGATIVVTTTADGGAGSLRDAVAAANGAESTVIELAAGEDYDLTCPGGGDLDHTGAQHLTIEGNGASIRQLCADERVIESSGLGGLDLLDVTITGGHVPGGQNGGGVLSQGPLVLDRATVSGNSSTDSAGGGLLAVRGITITDSTIVDNVSGGGGGGAWITGSATVTRSTIADNVANNAGGGIAAGVLVMSYSTLSGNTASDAGGGFIIFNSIGSSITNSTIADNSGSIGGGGLAVGQALFLFDTFSGNQAPSGAHLFNNQTGIQATGTVFESAVGSASCLLGGDNIGTHNYDDDGSCRLTDPTDVSDGPDPMLGLLGDNGGPTLTMEPLGGSPLIDGGGPTCPADDQRGEPRPQFDACDIGAVEVQPAAPPTTGTTTTTAEPDGGGTTTTTLPGELPPAAPQPQPPTFAG